MAASIKCDERPFKGGVWAGFASPAKNWGVWGAAPPSQIFRKFFEKVRFFFEKFSKFFENFSKNFPNPGSVPTLVSERSDGVTTTCAATVSGVVGTIVVLHAPWILPAAGTFEKQNK